MVRPLLISAGSRGDFEPLTALAVAMTSSTAIEQTTYFVQPDYISPVPSRCGKLNVVQLPYDLPTFVGHMMCAFQNSKPDAPIKEVLWSVGGYAMKEILKCSAEQVVSVAKEMNCDVVVTTICSWPAAFIASKVMNIPLIMLSFQPKTPSLYYPDLYIEPKEAAKRQVRIQNGDIPEPDEAYFEHMKDLYKFSYTQYAETLNALCAKFDVPPVTFDDLVSIISGTAPNMATINAVQPGLAPPAPDERRNTHVIGSLAVDYIPEGYDPQQAHPDLCAFLKCGMPPVVISYGSMSADQDMSGLTRALLTGMRIADVQRAIMLPGNANIGTHLLSESDPADAELLKWAKGRLFIEKGNVQYAWLLPQCEMLFCHGGAGCTSAALYAGIPPVITPAVFDQLFFAEIVKLMGVGTCVGTQGFNSVTGELVAKAIEGVRSQAVVERVREFSRKDKEDGRAVDRAIRIIADVALAKCA